ncbi:unnamed protein product [Rotaria magnacalcarata]|nr:unnamed protein product [Rotaria magnacalcarata]CAF1583889.1 unnamed protein product [Rotaria magnacalcarata]CAF2106077.1 unnamed protein product [Rotaria magnacalcarata]
MDLINYKLQTPHCEEGFEFKYEHTIMNAYIPHRSLTISVLNLTTLHVLLHYLPQLEYLAGFVYYLICLYVNSTELKHWFTNHRDNLYLNTFFRQIDHLYIDCSPISNINQHEEIMVPLLSFVIDKQRFRQLQCLRFDFIEKEQQVIDMKTGDEIVSIAEPPRIADIHRFVSENHLALWIQ